MSEPIKVGDLVAVVWPARCCPSFLGAHFIVSRLRTASVGSPWACAACGMSGTILDRPYEIADGHGDCAVAVHRLKRIPPLTELEGERTQEDLREPA